MNSINSQKSAVNEKPDLINRFTKPMMQGHSIELDLLDACQCEWCREQRKASQKSRTENRRPKFPEQKKIPKYLQPKKKRFYAGAIFLLLSIIATIALIPTINANLYYPDLRGNSITETAKNVDGWLTYAPNPKGAGIVFTPGSIAEDPMMTLITKKGDCTNIALVGSMILREYGIQTRFVTGYAWSKTNNESGYHDWYEYRNESGQWTTFETLYFKNLTIYDIGKLG